jgi:hypothetical protein
MTQNQYYNTFFFCVYVFVVGSITILRMSGLYFLGSLLSPRWYRYILANIGNVGGVSLAFFCVVD